MKNLVLGTGLFCFIFLPALQGQIFWEQPLDRWSRDQALSLLTDSPWATQVVLSGPSSRIPNAPEEAKRVYTIRLFSALPVRQALLKTYQATAKYERMDSEERRRFDEKFQTPAKVEFDQYIVVSLNIEMPPERFSHQVSQFLEHSRTERLKSHAFLINNRQQKIELAEYYPPTPDGSGAKFLFPRYLERIASVEPDDQTLQFEFLVPITGDLISVTWDLQEMIFRDRLEL